MSEKQNKELKAHIFQTKGKKEKQLLGKRAKKFQNDKKESHHWRRQNKSCSFQDISTYTAKKCRGKTDKNNDIALFIFIFIFF